MRVAALNPEPDGKINPIYRTMLPMAQLGARGHSVYVCQGRVPDPQGLLGFDVVCFWRAYQPPEIALAQMLRRAGVAIVWDDDDDIVGIPRGNPLFKTMGGAMGLRTFQQRITTIMRCASLVTTPSATLAHRFGELADTPVRVLENYLPDGFGGSSGRSERSVTIAWVAGLEHRIDADRLGLARTLERLLAELPEARFVTVGVKLDLASPRHEHIDRVDYEDLPAFLSTVDVGIAPLVDVRYNQARSNIKLKEYAAAGAAWLASPIGPYADMGEQQGGRLVADDAWPQALRDLVHDGRARRKLAKRGAKWAKGETISRNVHRWEAAFEEAIERAAIARTQA